ncbi:poliovirus receptor-like [Onychomys torridus]|uniref:poliovirus receptor-like n=1 Tax=Onychomys torridus TaxID=38674 RepID=UPI00167F2756|nr:poliovirus receptor-like [Onychomys torridus]
MDHRILPARLPLLLLLLLLLCCALGRAASSVAVHTLTNVTGLLGESATLVCSLTPTENEITVTQVTWMRRNLDGSRSTVAVFHPKKGPSITDPERVRFCASSLDKDSPNASLAISHLRTDDEGNYECQFATFPSGSKSATVWLQVLARPTTTAEALKPSPTPALQEVAKCISTGGRPPSRIHWLSNLNGSIHETQEREPQQDTFTVASVFSVVPSSQVDGKNITCRVEHETFSKPDLRTVTLSVLYPPEVSISGYDNNWYVGRTEVALTCEAHSKPDPTIYKWSTTTGSLPNTTKAQGKRLLITTVDNTINNVTFICNVTNALGSGQGQVTVLVTGDPVQPHSGLGTRSIAGICVGIALPIIILVVFLWYKHGRSPPSRTSRSQEYSSVSNGDCPRDIEMNSITR